MTNLSMLITEIKEEAAGRSEPSMDFSWALFCTDNAGEIHILDWSQGFTDADITDGFMYGGRSADGSFFVIKAEGLEMNSLYKAKNFKFVSFRDWESSAVDEWYWETDEVELLHKPSETTNTGS